MIPYGKHFIDEDDIQEVVDILRNGTLTQGNKVDEFEENFSSYVGSKYAVAVSSGTAALHLACLAKNISKGDNVITSANTFVSDANCAAFVGANPLFTDIDQDSLNMCPQDLASKCQKYGKMRVIIPVHFAGVPCDMVAIKEIAEKYESIIIEDACHALGAKYSCGAKVGSCKYSDMTIFSLHPVKSIATGEGGVITTNDQETYRRLIMLRSHGIFHQKLLQNSVFNDSEAFINKERGFDSKGVIPWYFEMQELGFNYRLTEIQCGLGISQLRKLDRFIEFRKKLVHKYDLAFKNIENLSVTQIEYRNISAFHLYVVRINFQGIGVSRADFMRELLKRGVGSQVHYIPVPLHPYYQNLGYSLEDYKNTKAYYNEGLSLPLYYKLSDVEQDLVINSVLSLMT